MPKASTSSQGPQHRHSLPSDPEGDSFSHDETSENPPSPRTAALMRKRKNADAQAAFRARRANYIANLEETVTSLENAVRRLQDALRDARDEGTEVKAENLRLIGLLEGAGIDHRRASGSSVGDLLKPPTSSSLHGSPSHGPDFVLQYATGGLVSPGLSPNLPPEQQAALQQQASINSTFSPYFDAVQNLPADYLTSQNLNNHTTQHTRGISVESQSGPQTQNSPGQFDSYGIPRPGSAASGTSSHSSTHSFHGAFDNTGDAEPSMQSSQSAPALQLGFNDLNLYGGGVGAASAPGLQGGQSGPVNWNATFDPSSSQSQRPGNVGAQDQLGAENQEQETADLGRSDTVKASLHRRAHSHLDISAAASSSQQRHSVAGTGPSSIPMDHSSISQPPTNSQTLSTSQSDMFGSLGASGAEDPNSSFDFDPYTAAALQRHSRPGSSASAGSLEGDLGHPLGQPSPYGLPGQSQPHLGGHQQHMSGGDLDDGAYYSSEGDFNDFDGMDYMEGLEGPDRLALVDSLGIPGAGFGGVDPSGLSTSPYNTSVLGGYGTSPGSSPGFPGMIPPGAFGPNATTAASLAAGGLGPSSFPQDPSMAGHPSMSGPGGHMGGGMGGIGSGLPGSLGGPQQVPMSSTLAVIKAQAFGTSRKARTRAKRPGADSAAKVAMEALQLRAQGLGLDVDLTEGQMGGEGAGGLKRGGASVSRSGATVKRKPKAEEPSPGPQ